MSELLQHPTLAEAIVVLKDEPHLDAPLGSEAIESVRLLSSGAQKADVINTLLSLAVPMPVAPPDAQPTFGVDLSQFPEPPQP